MCELFAMSCTVPTTVNYSLEEFSQHGGLTRKNKDGWGICFYEDGDIRLIKEAVPASSSPWVNFIAEQNLASHCVLAHVRLASVGHPKLVNTHPFERELGGQRHVFAHNGTMAQIHDQLPLEGDRYRPVGTTDSEHAFCLLLERIHDLWWGMSQPPDLQARIVAVSQFAANLRPLGQANFLYSDGDLLFVHAHVRRHLNADGSHSEPRAPGLNMLAKSPNGRMEGLHCDGLHVEESDQEIVYFASVPLTEDDWAPIPEGTVLAIRNGREVARVVPEA